MSKSSKKPRVPKYRHQQLRGLAFVEIKGHRTYLGKFGTKESYAEYAKICAAIQEGSEPAPLPDPSSELSLNELIVLYRSFAENYYCKNGRPTSEVTCIGEALRPVRRLFGCIPAKEFSPLKLKAVLQALIDHGYARKTINSYLGRIKRLFAWATSQEHLPPEVYHGLCTVPGLKKGRSEARETPPVQPVEDAAVDPIETHVLPEVWAMVQMQRRTGMRPGEVVVMRTRDVDCSADVWKYTPESHKTEHHGKLRVILIGPKGQEVLRAWLRPDEPEAYLFSPARAIERFQSEKRKRRQSKVQPSQISRAKPGASLKPRERYFVDSYRRAIFRACDKLNRLAHEKEENQQLDEKVRIVPRWHPNRLRHSVGTEIRKEFGLEGAQVILGHASANTTQIYAARDEKKAREIIGQIG